MKKKNSKIYGWANMAKAAGWSVSQMRLFEKEGLVIHRESQGGKNIVWCYQNDLVVFLKDRKPYQPKSIETGQSKPDKSTNPKHIHTWVASGLSIVLVGLIGLRVVQLWKTPQLIDDYVRYETQTDAEGCLSQLDLITRKGKRQNIWNPVKVKENDAVIYPEEYVHSENMIQFQPKTIEYPAVLTQKACRGISPVTSKGKYVLPPTSSFNQLLGNGERIQDMYYGDSIQFLDDGFFHGWMVYVKSQGDFLSAVVILDRQFKLLSTTYHPGHIRGMIHFPPYLAVSASLNARENTKDLYRNSLFALRLADILTQPETQVLPFSENTIPTESRRLYYQVARLPSTQPAIYYSGFPGRTNSHIHLYRNQFNLKEPLLSWRALFGSYRKSLRRFPHFLYFNTNLELLKAFVVNVEVPRNEDYESYYTNFKYQKWEGKNWSPWMGAFDEKQ